MGSTGGEGIKMPAGDAAECSNNTTVEIKIKTLDSQTFTLRVDKCVPVPELKEQIASVTGVLSEQQRLICRGKVLKDDQCLSAYHVEDGHTLHLVVRQPVASSPNLPDNAADSNPSSGTRHNQSSRAGPGMVVGTFNISEQGDGAFPDLNRIVSALLGSFGVTRLGSGSEGIDLNQPPAERLLASPALGGARYASRPQTDQVTSLPLPVESMQPPIIPDSLTTLLQYLGHLRQEFITNVGGQNVSVQNGVLPGSGANDTEATVHSSGVRGLLTPESLAEVMSCARQLLGEQATGCLTQLAGQLESHSSVVDPLERSRIQSNALRSGTLIQKLGSMLLELGRAIMTLRMGQAPADALVNAGPSVFVSSAGPNPIMVPPLPLHPGANYGSVPVGAVQPGSGLTGSSAGTGFLPRNIDIRIRTGSLFTRRGITGSQPQEQVGPMSSNSISSDQQDAALPDSNSHIREPQLQAVPIRTVVAAVPASGRHESDSSRGSIGILYPVLARVQNVSLGNSVGTRASQASDQHQNDSNVNPERVISDAATQPQSTAGPRGSGYNGVPIEALNVQGSPGQSRSGFEQLLTTIFPQENVLSNNANTSSSGSGQSHTDLPAGNGSSQAPLSAVSDQGLLLSNILRQIIPMVSQNNEAQLVPSAEGANSDETQAAENPHRSSNRRSPQPPPSPKRRRLE
ncbi:ubiquitin-like domain-containing protein CIP73 isoform X3 [Andrographis paniculata]|uniref:ubiquitin-like domain-containing protein CIP73 isoform X3 n=1 Tax=Andrographis paniculata TaxID=175694 RepID=UPI0021E8D75A|nr:ubiquitin-like domain-containing protein CIP73 isoform X3 [Andrographis paniculata]